MVILPSIELIGKIPNDILAEEDIEPTKQLADVILPKGPEAAAVDLIAMGIWDDIHERPDDIKMKGIRRDHRKRASVNYSHMAPITIGEADLEKFYDPI